MTHGNDIPQSATTSAFQIQAVIAFAVSLTASVIGVWNLPLDSWQRGFFGG